MREKIGLPEELDEQLKKLAEEKGLVLETLTNVQVLIVRAMLEPQVVCFQREGANVLAVVEMAEDQGRFETSFDRKWPDFPERREELCRRFNPFGVTVLDAENREGIGLNLDGGRFYFMVEMKNIVEGEEKK